MGKIRDWPADLRKKINFRQSQARDDFVGEYIVECNPLDPATFWFFRRQPRAQRLMGVFDRPTFQLLGHSRISIAECSGSRGT